MVSSKQNLRWIALVVTGFLALASAGHAQGGKALSLPGLCGQIVKTLDAGLNAVLNQIWIAKDQPNGSGNGNGNGPGNGPGNGDGNGGPPSSSTRNDASAGLDPSGRQ